ncbi:HEAT repeat protein [Minicystis rosea]|nr:HEAT repeat protein [Minicystis rosea]
MTVDSSSTDKFVPYRGALRAAIGRGNVLCFTTVHAEGQPTPLYRLDLDKAELTHDALGAAGGAAIAADDASVFVAATDGHVYKGAVGGGKLAPLGAKLTPAPSALALLEGGRLAVLAGAEVVIVDQKSGAPRQRLPLPEEGSAIASDASGKWLAAGTSRGTLLVFDAEDKTDFLGGESKKIHEGAIGALFFDPDELRVYSTGPDNRILLTHVRGALEPEDRTGGSGHEGLVTAIALGPEDKLYTAGRDATIKTWTRGAQKRRPSTQKEGTVSAVALARVEQKGRPHLALLGEDRTIRLFPMDAGGKLGDRASTFHDAYALAKNELAQKEPARRKEALETLAGYADGPAIEILAAQASADPDHALKVQATTLLASTGSRRAVTPLEGLLGAPEEQVRLAALAGLRQLEGNEALRPLELSLGKRKRDIGVAAVAALAELAPTNELAMARLVAALDDEPVEVRAAAAGMLESIHDARAGKKATSAEGGLVALRSKRPDIRRLALVRFFQRKLLGEAEVLAALRRHESDADADVRRAAFLVSVMSRPGLAEALRARDRDLHRQLWELETFGQKDAAPTDPPKLKKAKAELSSEDARPLLEALASRSLDTCLSGARGLAALQDERAFGTLLQLTNEKLPAARVEACKALSDLGDLRASPRLRQMLRDGAGEVRDAAFSALSRLLEKTPLVAAEAGLLAPAEDVRGRGLQALVRHLKKEPPKGTDGPAIALLARALNDTAQAVRSEAFKASLGLAVGGEGEAPLRFALASIHADVRREVLNEALGRIQEAWAPQMVLDLFGDPDAGVRSEAFESAQKRSKGKATEPLAAALSGRFADLKLKAIDALSKKRVDGVRELLLGALDDDDEKVRMAAAAVLSPDELTAALASRHADVRARAAAARASAGDAAALAPLLSLVTEKEPDLAEKRAGWIDRVTRALAGLAELGASNDEVRSATAALLRHKDKPIREAAARALGWVSRPGGDLGPLREALAHPDNEVKQEAAFGLALVGDPAGLPMLKGLTQAAAGPALRCLAAALSLGREADDLLMAFLDHGDERVRTRALVLMMLIEATENDGVPDRCLGALSSAHPRVRLVAARALETFADPAAFTAFAAELINDRGDDKTPWTIPAATTRALGEIVSNGDPQLRGRAVRVLEALDDEKQERFDRTWDDFHKRFAKDIEALVRAGEKRKRTPSAYAPEELARVVVGAYAGLSRMVAGPLEMRVRQTALTRLAALAKAGAAPLPAVRPILLLALGDPAAPVRKLAFDSLVALGMPAAELGAEALAVGPRDVGVLGLGLLAGAGDAAAERRKVLEQVLLGNTDGLEEEAGKLLAEIIGWEATHTAALEARAQAARERSVAGLAALYEQSKGAQKALRAALASRYQHVKDRAAIELAGKKDAAAFDALVAMLRSKAQREAIDALVKLGDPRVPDALLDRVESDPAGDALVDPLFAAAGGYRLPATADRLLAQLGDKKRRRAAFGALLAVSGYDQPIADAEDERVDTGTRVEHPRRDDVLAKMIDTLYRLGDAELLGRLVPAARWARGSGIDTVLAPLAAFTKDDLRNAAIEAIGFRLRKRNGPAEPLVAALGHKDPVSQFAAAEALALAGRADGIRVLLTAIDLVPEVDQRRRAVRALGRLGDARALDTLLRLAAEDGHALQEEAAEAIGHLKSTPKGPAIEELLLRLAQGEGGIAQRALAGLRWFDSQKGWALVRARAVDENMGVRSAAIDLLSFDADPAGRAVLVDRIEKETSWHPAAKAAEALRRWEPEGSLEPDYVLLGARLKGLGGPVVERLRDRGEPARILAALPRIQPVNEDAYLRPLSTALFARDPLPIDAAVASLDSVHERVSAVAAQILGRAGKAVAKAHGKALTAALKKALEAWTKARADIDQGRVTDAALALQTERCRRLIEAAGKMEVAADEVVSAASLGGDDTRAQPIRMEALAAIAGGFAKKAGLEVLAAAAAGTDARQRAFASSALRALAPDRAAEVAAQVVDDRSTLGRLVPPGAAAATLRAAAASVHTQGSTLPLLVAAGDVTGIQKVLADRKLSEGARLGAVEALGRIATDAAFAALYAFAKTADEDEELRKAAFRAARRGHRYQAKRSEKREVAS